MSSRRGAEVRSEDGFGSGLDDSASARFLLFRGCRGDRGSVGHGLVGRSGSSLAPVTFRSGGGGSSGSSLILCLESEEVVEVIRKRLLRLEDLPNIDRFADMRYSTGKRTTNQLRVSP